MPKSMILDTSGELRPDVLYHIDRFAEIVGWGAHARRQARRDGLKVLYVHGKCYIEGSEGIRYIRERGKPSKDA